MTKVTEDGSVPGTVAAIRYLPVTKSLAIRTETEGAPGWGVRTTA